MPQPIKNGWPTISGLPLRTGYRLCQDRGQDLKLNAFLPDNTEAPVPAIVEIHGGWWFGGGAASTIEGVGGWQFFMRQGLAVFSIQYRLGEAGGFPQNIRDCRNAIRFIRQNAKRFNIDPNRIMVTGGSAGGHLSLMVAMVPEGFPTAVRLRDSKVSAPKFGAVSVLFRRRILSGFGIKGRTMSSPMLKEKFPFAGRMTKFPMIHIRDCGFCFMELLPTRGTQGSIHQHVPGWTCPSESSAAADL